MVEYRPSKPILQIGGMPESIRPHAIRQKFGGTGQPNAPIVHGWIVFSHGGPNGGVSGDPEAKAWLKRHGFQHSGRRWHLRDDFACGEDSFELAARGARAA